MVKHSEFSEKLTGLGLGSTPYAKVHLQGGATLLFIFFIEGYSGQSEEHRVFIPCHLILPKSYFVFPGHVPGLVVFDELRALWIGREANPAVENALYGTCKFNGDRSLCTLWNGTGAA